MASSDLPFTVRILGPVVNTSGGIARDFSARLPATTRSGRGRDQIIVPQPDIEFLERELSVKRINDVQDWLWVCGRPMPARPLHQQILHSRALTVCEDIELHLVWHKDRIFIKPIPLYLLDPDFWASHLLDTDQKNEEKRRLAAYALGFMFSYATLVAYQSDFNIAQETGLLPKDIEWHDWKTLTAQLLENHCYASINPRYWYGELRMSRLNKVYRYRKGAFFRGYSRVGSPGAYEDLLQNNFATLASILGYVVIVLTAMQVGLGVDKLQSNQTFQDASYGFTVFSIVAPLAAVVFIFLFVIAMFASNWKETKKYERRRFQEMGVEAYWRKRQ